MNNSVDAFMKSGLGWLYERAAGRIRDTRLAWKTNDIVLFATTEGKDASKARIYGRRREDVLQAFRAEVPELTSTLARLSEVLPIDRVHLVIVHDNATWLLDVYVPKDAGGVLN